MNRLLIACVLVVFTSSATPLQAAPAELTWEEANTQRMFVLSARDGSTAAIVVDTTRPKDLRVAVKLQELIYRIGGQRLPIIDDDFVRVRWGKIHLHWDYHPMKPREHLFYIMMRETDPDSANPPKQIMIGGGGSPPGALEKAVSAFTDAAFGVPLEALDDADFNWPTRNVLAIPEDFGPIYGQREIPKKDGVPEVVTEKLEDLFQKYYPEATFTNRGVNGIHVEYKTTQYLFPPKDPTKKHETPVQRGPKEGGIVCHVYFRSGPYNGQLAFGPARPGEMLSHVNDRQVYKQLLAAPYSPKRDAHLKVSLSYPPDVSEEFLKEFRGVLENFEVMAIEQAAD